MIDITKSNSKMDLAEFEQRLPEFFATNNGTISNDPRLQAFLLEHPDAAALVRDFEAIVQAAQKMFDVEDAEPSESVWQNIQSGLQSTSTEPETAPATLSGPAL